MRPALLIGAIALLLTAGCSHKVQSVAGAAAPVTASTAPPATTASAAPTSEPATSEPATSEPATSATPVKSPSPTASAALVLGPNSYGKLKLGMSAQAATATGLIKPWRSNSGVGCVKITNLKAAPSNDVGHVYFSTKLGLEIIEAYGPSVRTAEGIHLGSTTAALFKAYPDWTNAEQENAHADGRGYADVPGNSSATYRIVTRNGQVTEITLQNKYQDCYE